MCIGRDSSSFTMSLRNTFIVIITPEKSGMCHAIYCLCIFYAIRIVNIFLLYVHRYKLGLIERLVDMNCDGWWFEEKGLVSCFQLLKLMVCLEKNVPWLRWIWWKMWCFFFSFCQFENSLRAYSFMCRV